MSMHMATLKVLTTVGTCNWSKLTANKLLALFWVQIQVSIKFSQLPCPLAATLLVYAPHTKAAQFPSQSFVGKHAEIHFVASRTHFRARLDALDTRSAEAVTAAYYLKRLTKNKQTYGTIRLQLLRSFHELTIITTVLFWRRHTARIVKLLSFRHYRPQQGARVRKKRGGSRLPAQQLYDENRIR